MKGQLFVKADVDGARTRLLLRGSILAGAKDEMLEATKHVGGRCTLDLSDITVISSIGIAEWIAFMKPFSATREVRFANCPHQVAQAFLLVRDFAADAVIESLLVDYRCRDCETEERFQMPLQLVIGPRGVPVRRCGRCAKCLTTDFPLEDLRDEIISRHAVISHAS